MFHPLQLQTFAKVCFLEIRWTWWSRILCLKIEHFTFHLAPYRQGIILPHPQSEMKGDLSFALCLYPHLSLWQRIFIFPDQLQKWRDPDSEEPPLQVVYVARAAFAFCKLCGLAYDWLLLTKNMGAKCSAFAAKQGLQSRKKDAALKLSFAKPPWAAGPLELSSASGPSCPSGVLRHVRAVQLQPPPGSAGARRGASTEPAGTLPPPALGTHQESQVWRAGAEKLADGQVECHDPSDSFLPLFSSSPPRRLSGSEGGVPGARQGVWVLGRCCCFAFWAFFFCMWICRQLFACCFSIHAWRSLIHRIASVRASVWQLGTAVSLEQRRPVSCRVVLVKTCPICCFLSPFLSVLLTHAVWSAQLSIAVTSHFELPLLWLMFAFSLGKC